MTVQVNPLEGNGVELIITGAVYGHDIIRANEKILHESQGKLRFKLIDKSACTEYGVTADEMKVIAECNRLIAEANPGIVMAIVESRFLQFSLTALWQAIVRNFNLKNESFHTRETALEWIQQEATPL